jgi:voltage-gated potassium channel
MASHIRGLLWAALLLVLVHIVGTLGYKLIGGPEASWIDSFYMTFITVATIGYGEIVDLAKSPGGRVFTVVIAFFGIGTMTYMFSMVTAFILESDLNAALRRKRMQKRLDKLSGHYIVCGIGRVGANVADELRKTGRQFAVIESDRTSLDANLQQYDDMMYIHGDAADDDHLRAAGVERAKGVFAVTGDDSHNLVVSLSAKQLNPKVKVVARVHDIRNADKTRRAGADEIVSPDFTGGMRIASAMLRPHVVNFMDQMLRSDDGLRVEEVIVPEGFTARRLGDIDLKSRDYILMATHESGKWVFNPDDGHVIRTGYALVVMANPVGRAKLIAQLAS